MKDLGLLILRLFLGASLTAHDRGVDRVAAFAQPGIFNDRGCRWDPGRANGAFPTAEAAVKPAKGRQRSR